MDRLGMNADAVDALAGRLDGQANELMRVASIVDGLVARALFEWHGRSAQDFSGHWRNSLRPATLRAAETISGLAESARRNAAEQRGTSGQSGSAGAPSPMAVLGVGAGLVAGLNQFTKVVGITQTLGAMSRIKNLGWIGRGVLRLDRAVASGGSHAFATAMRSIRGGENLGKFLKGVPGPVGAVSSLYDIGTGSNKFVTATREGDVSGQIRSGADVVGSGLQAFPSPVTYLGGTAIKTWNTAMEGLDEAWGSPPPSWSDVAKYGPESLLDAVKTVWGDL